MLRKFFDLSLLPLLFLLSLFSPKRKNRWIFGSWFGMRYSDSPKYLFEYVSDNMPEVEAIWVSRDDAIVSSIREQGRVAYRSYSLAGLINQVTAKVFIGSVNSRDFALGATSPRNFYVQLWHGSPLKKIGFDSQKGLKLISSKIRSKFIDRYDMIVSPSAFFDPFLRSAFDLPQNKIFRSSYPRCDGLFLAGPDQELLKQSLSINGESIVLFLPTHRSEGSTRAAYNKAIFQELCTYNGALESSNAVILFKPHYYESEYFTDLSSMSNVRLIADSSLDLYEALSIADILITDYSSVCFDFDATQKPTLFLIKDLEHYQEQERSFYFPIQSCTDRLYSDVESLIEAITEKNFSHSLNIVANELPGPGSSERVAREIQHALQ